MTWRVGPETALAQLAAECTRVGITQLPGTQHKPGTGGRLSGIRHESTGTNGSDGAGNA